MNWIAIFMNIGTLLAALGTLPQIIAVWRDRNVLRGYTVYGTAPLAVAMILFALAFYLMGLWFSVICEVPPATFWTLASIYSFRGNR